MVSPYVGNNYLEKALVHLQNSHYEQSFNLIKKASVSNNVIAQYYLAQCHEYGIGTPENKKEAFLMYRRAAERGFAPAMKELARCYYFGIGVEKNSYRADEWHKRYDDKKGNDTYPDLIEIYTQSLAAQPILITPDAYDTNLADASHAPDVSSQIPPASSGSSNRPQSQTSIPEVSIIAASPETVETVKRKSDVDIDIPETGIRNENTFAFIMANENYQDVAKVENALNDGEIFSVYCRKILGIPSENIHFVKDATLNNIKREINLLKEIAKAYKGEASFIIYYAGHGLPDEKTQSAYILPVDGYTADMSTCFSLSDLYADLGALPTNKIVLFIDACFSGSLRGEGMLASARGVAIKAKPGRPTGSVVVISSAQGNETAYPYDSENHGLFTYFLLKKLKESKGNVSLGELMDYIHDNVKKKSIVINGKSQTPSAIPSETIGNEWKQWILN